VSSTGIELGLQPPILIVHQSPEVVPATMLRLAY
jgi:hypothetical protein